MVHIHCEEEGDYLVDTETEKRESSTKAGERQEEPVNLPKDVAKGKGRKAGEEIQSEEEIRDLQTDTAKKKRKKPRKTNQEEEMESGNAMVTEKKNTKIRKLKKNVQTKEKTADDTITEWKSLFGQNIFKCLNTDCSETFISWAGLFEHFRVCKFPELAGFDVMLPCHACSKDFRLKPDFVKHIRLQHRDVYDLVHSLESGNTTKCFNYKCTAVVETYEDCVKHGVQCGSLIYCDKCQRSYKTRKYFSNHSCIGEKEEEAVKVDEILTSTNYVGKRRAAKRALDALHTTDSDDVVGFSSSQSKGDHDFEANSDSDGDSAEYEEDDGDYDDTMNDLVENSSRSSVNQRPIQNLAATCTTLLKGIKGVYRRRFKPWKGDIKWLFRWYRKNQSSFVFPEWTIAKDDIQVLSASEAAEYFPLWRISPPFNVVYEKCNEHACRTEFKQIKTFEVSHLEGSSITTFFVGGPVSAMEWCPCKGAGDQFLAVTTIGNYAQASDWSNRNSLIQMWRVPNQSNACKTVTLPMAIAIEFGSVYCMKWCPSSGVKDMDADGMERLGLLAISCGRDSIRILSVPHPSNIEHQIEGSDSNFAIIRSNTVLILATRRQKVAKADETENKVTCIEWQPIEGHKKIAAGFLDGTICIWNLECKSQLLRISDESECCDVILPFLRINAHLCCVNSLSWCPTDANFILSVSFDKSLKIFDIREKDAPAIIYLKKCKYALFEKCAFLLRVGAICVIEDELGNNLPVGSRFLDFVYCSLAKLPYSFNDHSTSHKSSCLGISNSEWMNAIVTSCCEGEVIFRALAHESMTEKGGGKSIRLPVYHIELSNIATSEEGEFEVDDSISTTDKCSTKDESTSDESVKDIIIERVEQLQTKLYKHKFTFVDSNFFEFRNAPGRCEVEVKRIRCWKPNEKSNFFHDAMCQVSQVQWNPNYGQHFLLGTGGSHGFVRLHYFTNWK